jgi:mannitol/fructose-specific phosphotransferase system IIA component
MGNKIALPHGEYEFKKFIKKSGIVVHVYPEPIDWHGEQVQLVVGLAGIGEEHVAILANIATVFGEIEAVDEVLSHQDVEIIYDLLTQEEVE